MKIYKDVLKPEQIIPEKKIPATWRREYQHTICDICKKPVHEASVGNEDRVEVKLRLGDSYPEGGYGTDTEFDVCVKCFEEKLIPWFKKEFDAEPTRGEWDW